MYVYGVYYWNGLLELFATKELAEKYLVKTKKELEAEVCHEITGFSVEKMRVENEPTTYALESENEILQQAQTLLKDSRPGEYLGQFVNHKGELINCVINKYEGTFCIRYPLNIGIFQHPKPPQEELKIIKRLTSVEVIQVLLGTIPDVLVQAALILKEEGL